MGTKKDISKFFDKPFKIEDYVKSKLVYCYRQDGDDFLYRYKISKSVDRYFARSYRAKLAIDLLFAGECYLKSCICSLSKSHESPEYLYKKIIRRYSHDLSKLHKEVKRRAFKRIKFINFKKDNAFTRAKKISVGLRYWLDVLVIYKLETASEHFSKTGKISGVIDNEEWHRKFYKEVQAIRNFTHKCADKYMKRYKYLHGTNWTKGEERLYMFIENIKN
jgi:hypothetical protein